MNKINKRVSNVLLVSPDANFSDSTKRLIADFQEKRCEVELSKTYRTALKAMKTNDYDVCLIDLSLGRRTGLELLHNAILQGCRTPLILLTGETDEKVHIAAMRTGAACCLTKEKIDAPLLEQAVGYAVERGGGLTELRENVDKFRNLVETLPVMIYAAEPQPPYAPIYISPAFEAFGYSLEEWTRRADLWMSLLHPEDSERILRETDSMMNAKRETDLEYRVIAKDGAVHWVHDRGHFVRDKTGKLVCWQGVILDITTRKRAEEEAHRREKLYLTLAQNILNTSVSIFDRGFRYSIAEINLNNNYGFTSETVEGKTLWEFFPPDVCAEWSGYYNRVLAGETVNVEGERNGEFYQAYVLPVKNENDEIFAGMVLWQDITERKLSKKAPRESETRYRDIFENAKDLVYTRDLSGRFTSLNRAGEIITGYTREELLQMNADQLLAPDYRARAREMIARENLDEPSPVYELDIISKQGERIPLELSTRLIMENGTPVGIQGIARDITERKRAEQALINSEQRYRLLGEGIMHQIWTAQPDGKINYANRRTLEYFGLNYDETPGDDWRKSVHPEDLAESVENWTHSLATGDDYLTEFRLRRHDGRYFWFQARAAAGRDAEGNIVSWFGTNTDIDDRKKAEAKLKYFAGHDTLTNLPNRARFMNHLERAVQRSDHNPAFRFAVLFLDLDRFKIINDSLGHSIGDKLLIEIAGRLEECVRPHDIVARLGGDEFTVLLTHINEPADAVRVADRFLERIAAPFNLDNYEVFTSASVGIIISDEVERQPEDFLRDADTAMYRAKATGKSRYEIFDREMHVHNMNLLQMENDLRKAIERNEFKVFYQPIVKLETGEIGEFEALIRWQHPRRGLVFPNEFITIAEETGLIVPIGRWILEEACRQTAEWQKRFSTHRNLLISVNLSAKQLMHPNLTAQVREILAKTELGSRCLKLEVTESMVMENSDKALSVISDLNTLGIALSTDDFGTGHSSLSYLHRFPFSRLKVDRSFVSKMDSDQKSEAIVRTILLLAQNLNIEVVAEGIETESQLRSLRQLDCKAGQGYLFSKPVPAEAAAQLLQNGLPNPHAASFYRFGETENHQLVELDKVQ